MITEAAPAICFGRSSSVVFNKVDAPIELKPRSLSRGRSVLNKSALRKPKDWTSPRRNTSLRGFDSDDDEDDGRGIMKSGGIMHPPSCVVAGLEATGRDEYDPDEASASWYKEASRTRQSQLLVRSKRYPTSPSKSREKTVVSVQQLEIERRFNRSRKSAENLLSGDSGEAKAEPRVTADIEREFATLMTESRNPPTSVWHQLQDVATEIGNTFSDEEQ